MQPGFDASVTVLRLVGGCWLEFLAPVLPADDGELVAGLQAVAGELEGAEEGDGLKLSCGREGIFGGEVVAVVRDQCGGVGLCRQVAGELDRCWA